MMSNYLVFREEPLKITQINHREEHNERTADVYANGNINLALSSNNIYFVKPAKGYQAIFDEKIESGEITTKGLKTDAAYFSEVIVAVNKDFWKGKSDEYIYRFFEAANAFLVKKFGVDKVISSVVHCDEIAPDGAINYHLHFVAIPTVQKKRYYSKRSKQYVELALQVGADNIKQNDERLLKETECQVSHSKFFESPKDEQHRIQYSYAIWQDEILAALKAAGFDDIKRGVENQHAKHMSITQFKAMMERIEAKAESLLPDIKAEPFDDDNYLVEKNGVQANYDLREQVAKEKATYDEAVEELVETQKAVYNRQNEVYQVALRQQEAQLEINEVEYLKAEANRLRLENRQLKEILQFLKEKVSLFFHCFKNIVDKWLALRDADTQEKARLFDSIDSQVRQGASLLYDEAPTQIATNIQVR